ncbi:hypothetical protein SLS58_000461 [Diplodia intermedia]|uniref:histidine kinase n=1 Tax=Diplodia intermedia TaxID=856260 RepID=A0ABR3U6G3_9PEZI
MSPAVYPEAARERDLHRYFQPWLDAQSLVNVNNQGASLALTYRGFRAQPSRDKALTAFAQLAALRLSVRRAMVSLIDAQQQYILAEATKTLSLVDDLRHGPGDNIWLGQTVIARHDGVEENLFGARYTATDEDGSTYTGEGLVIPDLRLDDRFKDRDYVKSEPAVRFYAGVPIRTRAGHRIGAYSVSDENPRHGLTVDEFKFMQDVAATVMEHLEMAKDRDDRNKGERMVRGLADFIEGVTIEPDGPVPAHLSPTIAPNSCEDKFGGSAVMRTPSFRSHSATLKKQTENSRIQDKECPRPTRGPSFSSSTLPVSIAKPERTEHEDDIGHVFHRAANIIRASTGADGVVFFGTVSSDIKTSPNDPTGSLADPSDDSQTSDSGPPSSSGDQRLPRRTRKSPGSTSSISKEAAAAAMEGEHNARLDKICEVVGLSTDPYTMQEEPLSERSFNFSERSMERYIKRFPHGKFFSFTDQGAGISSDEKSDPEHQKASRGTSSTVEYPKKTKKKEKLIPTELLKVLPGIRSLIFLPMWDPTVERWVAGAFIWTSTAGRLMSPDNELPYLKAFSNSIMSEVARVNAQKADRAKTTFIASISHELRSPLHGILGSVEFLHETAGTSYQASLFTSIEICGKTLLDTIDHVLDYAKINKLGRSHKRKKHEARLKQVPNGNDNSVMGVTAEFDLSALVEEVVEAVCAGDAFKKAHAGAFHDAGPTIKALRSTSDAFVKESVDVTQSTEDREGRVTILLNVHPTGGWNVKTQPGALRRIVMNLLGNALKYTTSGHVIVNLHASRSADPARLEAHLRVIDTGIGMSVEYQRTRLFSPFSQEDPFAVGTGLGLSIVRQIIDSLGGTIDVKSTKNVGTEVDVFLTLPLSAQQANDPESTIMPAAISTRGMRACLLIPETSKHQDFTGEDHRLISSFRDTCYNWFEMDFVESTTAQSVDADLFFVTEPSLVDKLFEFHASKSGTAPLVIVCRNPSEEIALKSREEHRLQALGRHVTHIEESRNKPSVNRAISAPAVLREHEYVYHPGQAPPVPHRNMAIRSMSGSEEASGLEIPERSLLRDAITASAASPSTAIAPTPAENALNRDPSSFDNPHLRILVVDDNPINLQLLVMFMKKHKFAYTEATNGLEAFERYKDATMTVKPSAQHPSSVLKSFDFVLMDISMPVMDGLASTREIRRYEHENGVMPAKIVALTGLASAQAQEEAMGSGINDYLPKPVKFAELKKLVEKKRAKILSGER